MPVACALCAAVVPTISARTRALPLLFAAAPAPAAERLKPPVAATAIEAATTSALMLCVDVARIFRAPPSVIMLFTTRAATT